MLNPGDVVNGKYRIERKLGDGAMGIVYAAQHMELGTPVALKFLHAQYSRTGVLAQRFLREARVAARIQSPYVTRVVDVDTTAQGGGYLVMDLLKGESLAARLGRNQKLSQDEALDLAIQVLAGVEAAHALGVVHRDLKPDNIFLAELPGGAHVKLLDFGIAKLREPDEDKAHLTQPGSFMGTPEYMAPEQTFSAETAGVASDLFSVGVLLYQMLSGRLPATGDEPIAVAAQHLARSAPRLNHLVPSVPDALATLVHLAMSPVPEERPPDARAFRLALAAFATRLSRPGRLAAETGEDAGAPSVQLTAHGTVPVKQVPMRSVAPTPNATPRPEKAPRPTSAATPSPTFQDAARTPDGELPQSPERVVTTAVPAEIGPPPATRDARKDSARAATQDMPVAGHRTPTAQMKAVPPEVSMEPGTQKNAPSSEGSNAWIWIVLVLLLLGGAGAGAFIYTAQTDIGPPPPLPTPVVAPAPTVPADAPVTAAPSPPPSMPASPSPAGARANPGSAAIPAPGAVPAPVGATATGSAPGTATAPTTPSMPAGLPTALPAGLPTALPAGIPTALPTAIPTALPTGLPPLPTAIPTALPAAPAK